MGSNGGSPGRCPLYHWWQLSWAGCVRVTWFLCGLLGCCTRRETGWGGSLC